MRVIDTVVEDNLSDLSLFHTCMVDGDLCKIQHFSSICTRFLPLHHTFLVLPLIQTQITLTREYQLLEPLYVCMSWARRFLPHPVCVLQFLLTEVDKYTNDINHFCVNWSNPRALFIQLIRFNVIRIRSHS